jgi:apolipoprotein N-acyltransferase
MSHLPLWGWWPLALLLSFWLMILLIFYPKDADKRKWLGASTLSGVMLGLGFPPSMLTWVVFFAWIPLLAVENGIYQKKDKANAGQVLFHSFNAFVLWNIIATFWVTNTAFIAGIMANFINAFFMAFVMMMIHVIGRRLPVKWFFFVFISGWISFEFLHHHWELLWPWLTLGNALAEYPWAVQWYEYTGTFGGTFWILGINVLGYILILKWIRGKPLRIETYIGLIIVPVLISLTLWFTVKPGKADPVAITIVQPNFEPHYEKFTISQRVQSQRFLKLSRENIDSATNYLVFPETSFEGVQLNTFRESPVIQLFQHFIDSFPQLHLVAGLTSYRILKQDELMNTNFRTHIENDGRDTTYWDVQNSAIEIASGHNDYQIYFKSRLVPGPEILPYKKYLFFLNPIIEKLGGTFEGLTEQRDRTVFKGGPLNIGPIICYESIFGDYTGGYVRNGATALFIVTNDGWWDRTPGHIQHLKLGALRAIEHRRPIARSANTGISAFIDIKGRILQPTEYGIATAIKGYIIPETRLTFYTRFRDIIAWAMVAVTFSFILFWLIVTTQNKFHYKAEVNKTNRN